MFDHDPVPGAARRNSPLAFWGGRTFGHGGHPGFDWPLSRGTPVFAAGDGVVLHAGVEAPFHCFITGRTVRDQRSVKLLHERGDGHRLMTVYAHLERVDVTVGESVTAGTPIGTAGSSGCSTGAHLHFETWRWFPDDPLAARRVDPFGWTGEGPDPWREAPEGATSVSLWLPGKAPEIYRDASVRAHALSDAVSVGVAELRAVSGQAPDDPNQEWVRIAVHPNRELDQLVMTGWTLRNNAGAIYAFPEVVLHRGQPLTVYSGRGTPDATRMYWGRTTPVWDDTGDCARLFDPTGQPVHALSVGRDKDRLCDPRRDRGRPPPSEAP